MNKLICLAVLAALASGCAHEPENRVERQLDARLASEPGPRNHAELAQRAQQLIETVPGLSAEQRSKLALLRASASAESARLHADWLKLQSLLIKQVLQPGSHPGQVRLVEDRLRKLSDQRLSLLFKTVGDANNVLGRWRSENDRLTNELLDNLSLELLLNQ